MAADRASRLGIFGGTFDPIHLGHLIIATELADRLELERVLFLPAARPPHKTDVEISPDVDRATMVELAVAGQPRFGVSYVDLARPGLSYTADSLATLGATHPDMDLYFLMGQDSLRDLPTWHDPNRIARQAMLGVALRPSVTVDVEAIVRSVPEAAGRIALVGVPLIQIASRVIRERVRAGRPISYQVTPAVERYINRRGLYRNP
ncbi:MAG TPA: nicotinate-nucleotide adenylyltransferase [Thermomicrobiaceae bacterium]|nr:nicotinate-nucleotide adenylyltransferase [Thermomicrobiaceae bacterium]